MKNRVFLGILAAVFVCAVLAAAPSAARHPRLLFDQAELEQVRAASTTGDLAAVRAGLLARAERLLSAPPLLPSTTKRGEPDPPGQLKGIESARRLQGRVLTYGMAFLLSGERRYRDAAVAELDHALEAWPIWVDTAHQPPFDLMTGELCLTYGLAYDWLFDALTPAERTRLREGVERRALVGYLDATTREKPMFWFTAKMNWNPVTNGGATILALALGDDSELSERVVKLAAPAMAAYWNELEDDGAWKEGTGYWTYGHRYAFMAADALRRAGRREGAEYLGRPGARMTGYFPIIFNPGRRVSASFGDSPSRANDPLFYFLAREYRNPDFAWFEDQSPPPSLDREGWPEEALTLIWKAGVVAGWTPAPQGARVAPRGAARPKIPPVKAFNSIGWAMLTPLQPDPPFFLAFKNGSLAADHTHLDLNHVTVGVADTIVLLDLGNRPYPADYFDAKKRPTYYEISTAGHNSVLVGGEGQVTGRKGTLRGPFDGPRYTAFSGVADNAYQVDTPRARRHVVFVDSRYFVLLDEIQASAPVSLELRFHSYGTMAAAGDGRWTVTDGATRVDVAAASDAATGKPVVGGVVEDAAGWTKPVKVLRLRSGSDATQFTVATALFPGGLPSTSPGPGKARGDTGRPDGTPGVRQAQRGDELVVEVGGDRLTWRRGQDGLEFKGVSPAK